ncbi:muconolactone Delta-isomerase family protein [Haloechinothrix salitolerans]|uniref:Muconolactone Delta-isomerase family protein n=1 Tax=Haloechinothrix salitolerans TaxID=926830 RepID=A0ABW2C7Q2_9PSEU
MDFLVRVDASRAYELPEDERTALIKRERVRGLELMEENVIRYFWRVPGTRANVGIWSAPDADALEEVLASLPIRHYADIEVTALATHPMTRMREAAA